MRRISGIPRIYGVGAYFGSKWGRGAPQDSTTRQQNDEPHIVDSFTVSGDDGEIFVCSMYELGKSVRILLSSN